jgi:hypothetical protein
MISFRFTAILRLSTVLFERRLRDLLRPVTRQRERFGRSQIS